MARPIIGLLSLLFLAAAILFEFFIVLSGGVNSSPETLIYFLQADTNGMNAPNPARWTYWAVCGVDGNKNSNCGKPVPALPFDPENKHNFGSTVGVPQPFLDNENHYWYLSRFAWVFYLLALIFSVFAFLLGGLALCTRIGAYFSSLNTAIALFWQILASSLMTAWSIQARNVFRNNNLDANIGKYGYGFSWGTVALLFLSMISFCAAGGRKHDSYTNGAAPTHRRRHGFWRRRTSVRKEYV
jgi:hypothetical protein